MMDSVADGESDVLLESAAMPYEMSKSASAEDSGTRDEETGIQDVAVRSDFASSLAFEPFLHPDATGTYS